LAGTSVRATASALGIGRVNPAEPLKLAIDDLPRHALHRSGEKPMPGTTLDGENEDCPIG